MKRIFLSILIGVAFSIALTMFNPVIHKYATCGVIAFIVSAAGYFFFLKKSKNAFVKFVAIFVISFFVASFLYSNEALDSKVSIALNVIPYIIATYVLIGPVMKKR